MNDRTNYDTILIANMAISCKVHVMRTDGQNNSKKLNVKNVQDYMNNE